MAPLFQDLRYAFRMLVKSPGFTAIAVLTLALGTGANTAIFSLINAVLIKMLPVQNPQQLVLLDWTSKSFPGESMMTSLSGNMSQDKSGRMTSTSFSYPAFEEIRDRSHAFSSVMAMAASWSEVNVGYGRQPARAQGQLVSGAFFDTLGVQPILGRALTPDDDRLEAAPVAVISYGYWQSRFGRDSGIVGRTVSVNATPVTIVGVCPPEFFGIQPGRAVDIWLPIHLQPRIEPRWSPSQGAQTGAQSAAALFSAHDNWWVLIMGRLKPGVSQEQARAELDVILQRSFGDAVKTSAEAEVAPHLNLESGSQGLEYLREEFSKPLFILMTVVGLVLLIACANVANLMLARATARQKEIAIRLAMGAGRSRLIRQLLTESMLLSAMGGFLGLLLAFWATDFLVAFMSTGREPVSLSVTPDVRVLGFTAALTVFTGLLFGIFPALRHSKVDLTPALKESQGPLVAMGHGKLGLRVGLGRALVITQVAVSLLLLAGAGLFVRTLINLQNVQAGFDRHNLLLFGIDPTQGGYKGQRLADFYVELRQRLQALPGVRAVSMSEHRLIGGGMSMNDFHISGYTAAPGSKQKDLEAYVNRVGPGFFETMGIPLVLGRTVSERDTNIAPKIAVVNQKFAQEFFAGQNPIGHRFGFGDKDTAADIEIVGVVGNAKYNDLRRDTPATIYLSCLQEVQWLGATSFEVRTASEPMAMLSAIRRVTQAMAPDLALYQIRSQSSQIEVSLFQERLFARLTSFFGLLAAALACVGLYGIMAYAVNQRTREIGIRMALGATRHGIVQMVLRESFILLAAGVMIGLLLSLPLSRLIGALLFGLQPSDPLTLSGASLLMVVAAGVASFLPARRATKVDPLVALRDE